MDMKRLEISKLMDEYQDNEFFPDGGSSADTQEVKAYVLAQAGTVKKRRIPPLKAVLLAAVLGLASVLCIAAGLPMKTYQLFTSGTMQADVEMSGPNRHICYDLRDAFSEDPLVLENNRLWLVLNGDRTDITDRIDMETPYVIDYTDPETGLKSSLILGGTPEDFGWCLWQELPNRGGYGAYSHNDRNDYVVLDGVTYEWTDSNEDYLLSRQADWKSWDIVWKPWYEKGKAQVKVFSE